VPIASFNGVQVVDMRVQGNVLAAVALDGSFLLLNLANMQKNTLKLPKTPINLAFSDSEVAILMEEMVALVNITTLEVAYYPVPGNSCRLEAGFNCFFLAIGSGLHRFSRDFSEKASFPSAHTVNITDLKASPSGEYLASADTQRLIYIWTVSTLTIAQDQMVYHAGKVTQICWSPDSRFLLTGSIDKTVILWRIREDRRCIISDCHRLGVTSVLISKQNEGEIEVISTGEDLTIKQWRVPSF
jgi:WD40 repeat protein